ncbi:MAG: hypothetical protein IJ137_06525 [Eubacterium sp.]|nr:hypothetical protein [Eubacterium sp.]
MLKFTLLKQLYYAFDPDVLPEAVEKRGGDIYHRTLNVEGLGVPGVSEVTMQERFLPYSQLYLIYINDEQQQADITEPRVKAFIHAFFKHYHPDYLKADLPDDLSDIDILDCFDVDKMPGYQNKYAYREIQTLEDIRSGKADQYKQKHGFPGLTFSKKYQDRQ